MPVWPWQPPFHQLGSELSRTWMKSPRRKPNSPSSWGSKSKSACTYVGFCGIERWWLAKLQQRGCNETKEKHWNPHWLNCKRDKIHVLSTLHPNATITDNSHDYNELNQFCEASKIGSFLHFIFCFVIFMKPLHSAAFAHTHLLPHYVLSHYLPPTPTDTLDSLSVSFFLWFTCNFFSSF